jgi:hypothetical protein
MKRREFPPVRRRYFFGIVGAETLRLSSSVFRNSNDAHDRFLFAD